MSKCARSTLILDSEKAFHSVKQAQKNQHGIHLIF
jgi:hypothetical protein